ncbi:MAG: hypothetical protein WA185_04600 [Candidatus Acidiferrales bacterium]
MAPRPASHVPSSVASKSAVEKSNETLIAQAVILRNRIKRLAASAPSSLPPLQGERGNAPASRTAPRTAPRIARKRSAPRRSLDPQRHARKCQICRHPKREVIETDFIDWCKASWLMDAYGISSETTIYRHARATGLDVRRRQNLSMAIEKVLEHVDYIESPSPFAILRAARTVACINERGQWVEPTTSHVVISRTELSIANPPTQQPSPVSSLEPQASTPQNSNRQTPPRLEVDVAHTKQTSEHISNRPKQSTFSQIERTAGMRGNVEGEM